MKKKQPFQNERKQTDDSLNLERVKVDESFNKRHGNTNGKTDDVVSKDRDNADQNKLQRRNYADLKRETRNVCVETESAIENQRKSEDKDLEIERLSMDKALEKERKENERLVNNLVTQERNATDKNLLDERTKTDTETERSIGLLSGEQEAHLKTKSALTTREEFVAIVSHDLRNPIGAILSSTQILLEDYSNEGMTDDVKGLIKLIKRNAETSLRLIGDILDMERITEGKLQLELTKNRIEDLIKDSIESHSHLASSKNISLKTSSLNSNNSILFDKDRVSQILSNLIGNALKYTPAGGVVSVDAQEEKNEMVISVHDTGPGIPDDQKKRIFERFAQIKNKDRAGLGLGLYISKTLVESHSGKIWVTSKPGSGSTFSFTLPIQGVTVH